MDTTTIVVLAIWNGLLLLALAAAVAGRKRLWRGIRGADNNSRAGGAARHDDAIWDAFLAEHPELRSGSRS
jgi:hypothetical protein